LYNVVNIYGRDNTRGKTIQIEKSWKIECSSQWPEENV